ncbi:MAG: thiamine phosphate synthase [Campylobacterota bacterium]|nr:thiamine phosphate synthase [Campylobacterota bacterium]
MISYAITDPSTLSFESLDKDLIRFAKKADMIVYRDKENSNYAINAERFLKQAGNYTFKKILLHGDIGLASRLGADGIHLTGSQTDEIRKAKSLGLFVVISCHTLGEAERAENMGADMVTFSPVFSTPNKGKPLGLSALNELQGIISLPIIALGGILTDEQIDACEAHGASGFASIRYFQ